MFRRNFLTAVPAFVAGLFTSRLTGDLKPKTELSRTSGDLKPKPIYLIGEVLSTNYGSCKLENKEFFYRDGYVFKVIQNMYCGTTITRFYDKDGKYHNGDSWAEEYIYTDSSIERRWYTHNKFTKIEKINSNGEIIIENYELMENFV